MSETKKDKSINGDKRGVDWPLLYSPLAPGSLSSRPDSESLEEIVAGAVITPVIRGVELAGEAITRGKETIARGIQRVRGINQRLQGK